MSIREEVQETTQQQVVVTETKLVGSYAKGTMLKEDLCADIVAITKGMDISFACWNLLTLVPTSSSYSGYTGGTL